MVWKYRRYVIIILIMLIIFYIILYYKLQAPNMRIKSSNEGYFINTKGCQIPSFDRYGPAIEKFLNKVQPFKCSDLPPLVNADLTSLYVEKELLPAYNVTDMSSFYCCYHEFERKDSKGMQDEDEYWVSNKCVIFTSKISVPKEFVKVICMNNKSLIYKDYYAFVPFKKRSTTKSKLNVLIHGMDSVSRQQFLRQMIKTNKFITEELNAVDFMGYNKVADNTFPNVVPLLTGKSENELYKECCTSSWLSLPTKFDECNFIWNNYSNAGYLTAFAEETSWQGLFNHEHKRGFLKQPTDYYWKTFDYLAEQDIGFNPVYRHSFICLGARRLYEVFLDYSRKFTISLKNYSYFGYFWENSLTHDRLNFLTLGDESYELFFNFLKNSNVLNNTILIYLSDHGMRFGDIRTTHQGHLEDRLPFLFFIVPPWFPNSYPTAFNNLKINAHRLVTTYDLHETLIDLIDVEKLTCKNLKIRSRTVKDNRGISLFVPIPETRTCSSAGISAHWCTCNKQIDIDINSEIVKKTASFVVETVNKMLENKSKCAQLKLDSITDARLLISEEFRSIPVWKSKEKINYFIVVVKTTPGEGILESTVKCFNDCNDKNTYEIQGTITRLNSFARHSGCINDLKLKLYCYCI